MNHAKIVGPATGRTSPAGQRLFRGALAGLTLMSILVADPAMARRGKGGLPPAIKMVPVEHAAARPVPAQDAKPILHARRHGSKARGGAN